MDVIQEIISNSAIGPFNSFARNIVLSIFLAIVTLLLGMLSVLLIYGNQITIQFGY